MSITIIYLPVLSKSVKGAAMVAKFGINSL